MTKARRIKRGQIFLNLLAGWQSIFVVLGSNERCYRGIDIMLVKGEYRVENVEYYLKDLRNDEEHFPLIGEMDIEAMWLDKVLERITPDGRKFMVENYDFNGHKIKLEVAE